MIKFMLLLFVSCGTFKEMPDNPLSEQTLKARTGYNGLTHSRAIRGPNGERELEITNHDLLDEAVRKILIDFQFRCRIATRRFKICEDRPGFCRYSCKKRLFKRKCFVEEYIPMEPVDYHVKANTFCSRER